MKLAKINLKIFKNKYILFLFIFTFGISLLLYQIYIRTIQTATIENFDIDLSNPKVQKIVSAFSGFFQNKCLTGCVRLDSVDKAKCTQKTDIDSGVIYDCPWVCDTKKFDTSLKNSPKLAQELSSSARCSAETELKDCGSCVPNRIFTL